MQVSGDEAPIVSKPCKIHIGKKPFLTIKTNHVGNAVLFSVEQVVEMSIRGSLSALKEFGFAEELWILQIWVMLCDFR